MRFLGEKSYQEAPNSHECHGDFECGGSIQDADATDDG